MLRFLEKQGYTKLIGIEPSLPKSSKIGNIEFIKAFASPDTILERVDLIFARPAASEQIRRLFPEQE